jgi:outer membrane lipoprotein-sorting protein
VTVSMRNIKLNPKLDAGLFTFEAPTNAEVVDLRS